MFLQYILSVGFVFSKMSVLVIPAIRFSLIQLYSSNLTALNGFPRIPFEVFHFPAPPRKQFAFLNPACSGIHMISNVLHAFSRCSRHLCSTQFKFTSIGCCKRKDFIRQFLNTYHLVVQKISKIFLVFIFYFFYLHFS